MHCCTGIGVGVSLGTVFVLADCQLPRNAAQLNSTEDSAADRNSVIYLSTTPKCLGLLLLLLQLCYAGNRCWHLY